MPLLTTVETEALYQDQPETLIRYASIFAQRAQKDRPFYSFNPNEIDKGLLKSQPHQIIVDDEQMNDAESRQKLGAIFSENGEHLLVLNVGKAFVRGGVLENFPLPKSVRHLKMVNPKRNATSINGHFLNNCSLTTIDISALTHIRRISKNFLSNSSILKSIDISGLICINVIDQFFLSDCKELTTFRYSPLFLSFSFIEKYFLQGCDTLDRDKILGELDKNSYKKKNEFRRKREIVRSCLTTSMLLDHNPS